MNFTRYKTVCGIIITLIFFLYGGSLFSQNETMYPTGTVIPPEIIEYWKTHQPSPMLAKPQGPLATTKDWSWRDSSVKDQRSCGSCWAFAPVALVENIGNQNDLSEQAVMNCADGGGSCSGGWFGYALEYIRDYGAPPEDCAPYTASNGNCSNVCTAPPFLEKVRNINRGDGGSMWGDPDSLTITKLKEKLQGGPLVVFMLVPNDGTFDSYTGGIYDYDGSTISDDRGHAVLLVGYNDDEQSFTVKNSWGTSWGEGGYFRISYNDVQDDVQFGGYAMTASQAYTEVTTPVELGIFEVFTDKNTVSVEWATLSESNNYGFEIQRSSNGIEFESLAFVPGNGTTNVPQQYHYEDAGLAVGNYHYRLKQLDFDGSFMLTDVLTVDLNPPESFSLFQGYPNPFVDQTTLNFELPTAANVEIRIFNMLGQRVRTLTSADMPAGFHQVIWNGTSDQNLNLSNGYYFLQFSSGGNLQTQRLLLLR